MIRPELSGLPLRSGGLIESGGVAVNLDHRRRPQFFSFSFVTRLALERERRLTSRFNAKQVAQRSTQRRENSPDPEAEGGFRPVPLI